MLKQGKWFLLLGIISVMITVGFSTSVNAEVENTSQTSIVLKGDIQPPLSSNSNEGGDVVPDTSETVSNQQTTLPKTGEKPFVSGSALGAGIVFLGIFIKKRSKC